MSTRYSHIMAPFKLRNKIIKNHLLSTCSLPHELQDAYNGPSPASRAHMVEVAKNGAGIMMCDIHWRSDKYRMDGQCGGDIDLDDASVRSSVSHLIEEIHYYNTKAGFSIQLRDYKDYDVCEEPSSLGMGGQPAAEMEALMKIMMGDEEDPGGPPPFWGGGQKKRMITEPVMQEIIDGVLAQCHLFQDMGFDMVSIHMSYHTTLFARFLSPAANHRTDEYGGSIENRARFPLRVFQAIRKEFGDSLIIEAQISGEEYADGYTLEDMIAFAKMCEGVVDIFQLRTPDVGTAHPVGSNSCLEEPRTLKYARAFKKAGVKVLVAPVGGFQDPDLCEQWLSEGSLDLLAMGRSFICDYDYYEKIKEGRGEDVVPCLRCNRCHGLFRDKYAVSACSVNPKMGLLQNMQQLAPAPKRVKKVAVIGGGPAGMRAALFAAERGHQVTLFERNDRLGGQINYVEKLDFKWPMINFRDYLIRQLQKSPVLVHMSCDPTPEQLKAEGYDAILVAAGAYASRPNVQGADDPGVFGALEVVSREAEIGHKVVVIGGSSTPAEMGVYLAKLGHDVTVLSRQGRIGYDAPPIHGDEIINETLMKLDNYNSITMAKTIAVTPTSVTYERKGKTVTIACDSVVVHGGMKPELDTTMRYVGCADEVYAVGDADVVGNIQTCQRSAFSVAMML